MSLSSLSVKTRLFSMLGILAAALLLVGLLGLRALQNSNAQLGSVFDNNLMSTQWVSQMLAYSRDNVLALDDALLQGDPAAVATYKKQAEENKARIDALWEKYQTTPMAPGEKELGDTYQSKRTDYRNTRNSIAEDLAAGKVDVARQRRVKELQPYVDAMLTEGQKLVDLQSSEAEKAQAEAANSYRHALWLSGISIVLGIGLAMVLGAMLVRSMMKALNRAVEVAEEIAGGNLGHEIEIDSQDEFGRLLTALRAMDSKLSEIVGAVSNGADSVGSSARQLAQGNDDLSQRTQEQASALEETAASMEQMTATVKQNADNARQANQLGGNARTQADQGGAVVQRAINAMADINTSSRKIADIINVIDEIAFQTNLLALNAAVEAARAGEQGRGFAVVASEVRSLAQRSASAAKEIKDLINDSVDKVKTGTELVDASGKSLTDIMNSVKKVTDIVAEIAAASEEQAAGIDQVNLAITQMDSVTQQNAALVEEAAAASKSMEDQAQELVQHVGFFQREGAESVVSSARMRAPTPIRRAAPVVRPQAAVKSAAPRPLKVSGGDAAWTEF
ncbi:MAG: methyl-accepting chemotaxis protein [Steroidobacteraceae bacterium]